jgi:dTMP kinase
MTAGRFITVEGMEGAGKSSCMDLLKSAIEATGLALLTTREPGGTPLGETLRELLLGQRHDGMADDTELLLMFAARAEHLHAKILPALQAGHWVLCDRFTDATFAYQGFGRGISRERIRVLERWVQRDRRPDLTLLLDVPVAVGLDRAGKRSVPDRFERETLAFFERVREGYLAMAEAEPTRFRVIDASRPLADVQQSIRETIDGYLQGAT